MIQSVNGIDKNREQFIQKLKSAGITDDELKAAQSAGPESFKALLSSHGIQAPPAPPQNGDNDEFMKKLEAAGITKTEFEAAKAQGPEAVKALLKAHGIQPPDESKKAHEGNKTGNSENATKDNFIAKLEAAGITQADFAAAYQSGPQAVQKLFQAHGITPESGL